eukprot:scaffold143_cov260-Pinguiococcus_pyrenoidosus.AAC.28
MSIFKPSLNQWSIRSAHGRADSEYFICQKFRKVETTTNRSALLDLRTTGPFGFPDLRTQEPSKRGRRCMRCTRSATMVDRVFIDDFLQPLAHLLRWVAETPEVPQEVKLAKLLDVEKQLRRSLEGLSCNGEAILSSSKAAETRTVDPIALQSIRKGAAPLQRRIAQLRQRYSARMVDKQDAHRDPATLAEDLAFGQNESTKDRAQKNQEVPAGKGAEAFSHQCWRNWAQAFSHCYPASIGRLLTFESSSTSTSTSRTMS